MSSLSIFSGITEEEKEHMFHCFTPVKKVFFDGETIMNYAHKIDKVGILLNGRAHLSCLDYEGRHSILEQLERNDIFGEVFMLPLEDFQYFVVADTVCDVLFIDYTQIIKRCSNACAEHSRLVNNLLQMTASKAQSMALHINILSRRTTRQKLMTYFEINALKTKEKYFTIPMSLSALADYISVDRSSMMRELRKMKEEGLLSDKMIDGKRYFTLVCEK
ncbi:MAG: Crp/Fnr family transcriptional regulator [Clostridia bacterium]